MRIQKWCVWFWFLVCFVFLPSFCCFGQSPARSPLTVNEHAIHAKLQGHTIAVDLHVENSSHDTTSAHLALELVDPSGVVVSRSEQETTLHYGTTRIRATLPADFLVARGFDLADMAFYRLRYSVNGARGHVAVSGIVSVSEVTSNVFVLHVGAPIAPKRGERYALHVRATQPVTGRPVEGVQVSASLDGGGQKPFTTGLSITDRDGLAALPFTLPNDADDDSISVDVTGKLGDFATKATSEIRLDNRFHTSLATDKLIYQPGQTLHMRFMAFGPDKKAIAHQALTLKVEDPDNTLLYSEDVTTSEFGIAAADWQIPNNLRLGTYLIEAEGEGSFIAGAGVEISRYDLPTFAVTAKPDRTAYLPGQNAVIDVRADYLYGQPVRRGHVRVVHESDRKWNFREQKWETKEEGVWEGETDEQGHFSARVDLQKDAQVLEDNDYERFTDLNFAAYYTDKSTGRTEQRRFSLRLTKDSIHIYVIHPTYEQVAGFPSAIYVSTDYADGSPASCDVEIRMVPDADANPSASPVPQLLRRVRTNRYGVAKVSGLVLPSDADAADWQQLDLVARDGKGKTGHHVETMPESDGYGLAVETHKTLFKPDEPIDVSLTTNAPDGTFVVDAIKDSKVIASQRVRVHGGRGALEFLPNAAFQNEIQIVAYAIGLATKGGSLEEMLSASRSVFFPHDDELNVDVKLGKTSYQPGEKATVDLHVTGSVQRQKSAVGVAIVDEAVEERVKTDSEFGRNYGYIDPWAMDEERESFGGLTERELKKLDMSRPVPEGLDLVAEILLLGGENGPATFDSDSEPRALQTVFAAEIDPQIKPIGAVLDAHYAQTGSYPDALQELEATLKSAGYDLQLTKDPWGTPYQAEFSVQADWDILRIKSAGPDKTFHTTDDFNVLETRWQYFKKTSNAISLAVNDYHTRTGAFVRDLPTLISELWGVGVDWNDVKDPWGRSYRVSFETSGSWLILRVTSAGPDGKFDEIDQKGVSVHDDFNAASISIDYFAETRAQMDTAITNYFRKNALFAQDADQLRITLADSEIDLNALRDAWGHSYYATFAEKAQYSDSLQIHTYNEYLQGEGAQTISEPVTQKVNWIYLRSAGPDGMEGTEDDFTIASFARVVAEQSAKDQVAIATNDRPPVAGSTGAISGTVTDASGAVIGGAEIKATNVSSGVEFTAHSEDSGVYVVRNLPVGHYKLQISSPGFASYWMAGVPVGSSNITKVDVVLMVGNLSTEVTVSANRAPALQTDSSDLASKSSTVKLTTQISTPRLREYFPETLLWQPEVITDRDGHARLSFTLADNITTWKLRAIASTAEGEIGVKEKDIQAFQPFFVELDPPKVLTVGDEIALPVVLRNYLDHTLGMDVTMKGAPWFMPLSAAVLKTNVAAGDSANDVFQFRVISAIKAGKQEVSAAGAGASDAISKNVAVHPYGEEKTASESEVFQELASLTLAIPENALAGSVDASLKIYPNLNAHVLESIEAILERPYGCAEQTISAAYPGVLYLKYAKGMPAENSAIAQRARHYTQLAYERLLADRAENGGFSYWGGTDRPDVALTGYALRFLTDASAFTSVDPNVITQALQWVLSQAEPDGHWAAHDWEGKEDARRSASLTAFMVRTLVQSGFTTGSSAVSKESAQAIAAIVKKVLAHRWLDSDAANEPYTLASYALALRGIGDADAFASALQRLRELEHREGQTSYWMLETNTPFYGWGMAGRIETTALVLQALSERGDPRDKELLSRGLLFLIRQEDRYGIWYSTQATIAVLDTMASLTSAKTMGASGPNRNDSRSSASVVVDGVSVLSVELPPAAKITGPIVVDLAKFVSPGEHKIEIRRAAGVETATAQAVASYYTPWQEAAKITDFHHEDQTSDALRLAVSFDKHSAKIGETIHCSVDAERVGFRGYGMLLAEIGLPPGAEVDRGSLDDAMKAAGWDISRYDVLPDRVVVYLWPHAGGTKFSFAFKPRFGMKARSAASSLYDYYNPEAQAVVPPTLFEVQ